MGEEQKREHGWGGEVSELPTRSQTVLERKVQGAGRASLAETAHPILRGSVHYRRGINPRAIGI